MASAESPRIVEYLDADHREGVVSLWNAAFGYATAHNEPGLVIDRKLATNDDLFLVALSGEGVVVGTVMAGYDGHRGWIYSLAVDEQFQRRGLGSELLSNAERRLEERGCVKINLQIADGNEDVEGFYRRNGYAVEKRISMGKRLLK